MLKLASDEASYFMENSSDYVRRYPVTPVVNSFMIQTYTAKP